MGGVIAIVVAVLAFMLSFALPMLTRRWRSFALVLALGAAFFGWVSWDLGQQPPDAQSFPGAFIAGLMLAGFSAASLARFVMLISRQ